jgi:N-acetylmuramoyl-L-alanine amidase
MIPDYPPAIARPAAEANYGPRPAHIPIDCVVLHATAGGLSATLGWFANPASRVSAHYVVSKRGRVYQCVLEDRAAYHAGRSEYAGRSNYNRFSIGVEIVNQNDGQDPYPTEQLQALAELLAYLAAKYRIRPEWVVTHAQISTAGKTDPRGLDLAALLATVYGEDDPCSSDGNAGGLQPGACPEQRVGACPEQRVGDLITGDVAALAAATYRDAEIQARAETIRRRAWAELGVAYHPVAALARHAREKGAGAPLTAEFDLEVDGRTYRAQGFGRCILYALAGDWQKVEAVGW